MSLFLVWSLLVRIFLSISLWKCTEKTLVQCFWNGERVNYNEGLGWCRCRSTIVGCVYLLFLSSASASVSVSASIVLLVASSASGVLRRILEIFVATFFLWTELAVEVAFDAVEAL